MTVPDMSVNSCSASFPLGGGWVSASTGLWFSFFLSVHVHSVICAAPPAAPDLGGLLSEQKCCSSVCVSQSLGMAQGLWGSQQLASDVGDDCPLLCCPPASVTPFQVHEHFHVLGSLGNGEMSPVCRHMCQLFLQASRGYV